MNKSQIVNILNKQILGVPINSDKLIELVIQYLSDKNYTDEQIKAVTYLITTNPMLLELIYPKVMDYIKIKYTICSIMFNNKILCYYE